MSQDAKREGDIRQHYAERCAAFAQFARALGASGDIDDFKQLLSASLGTFPSGGHSTLKMHTEHLRLVMLGALAATEFVQASLEYVEVPHPSPSQPQSVNAELETLKAEHAAMRGRLEELEEIGEYGDILCWNGSGQPLAGGEQR